MPFEIPNEASAAFPDQAEPDAVDIDILVAAHVGNYVVSGCVVTAQGSPDMTVAVEAGAIAFGVIFASVAAGNVTIAAADGTNPRFDLIAIDNTGAKSRVAGTASSNPVFPAIPANSIIIAAVYVPANDTDIDANQIIDKRVIGQSQSIFLTDELLVSDEPQNPEEEFIEIKANELALQAGLQTGVANSAPTLSFKPSYDPGGGPVNKFVDFVSEIDDVSGDISIIIKMEATGGRFTFTEPGVFFGLTGSAYLGSTVLPWTQLFLDQYISMVEMTAPSAPAANGVLIYPEDNGAGKTRLMALFSSGAAQQIAIQP